MAQNSFIAGTASSSKGPDGRFAHSVGHASSATGDMSFGWDSAKITTKQSLLDFLKQCEAYVGQRGDLK